MRTELAQRAAELRQQELVAEVVKPAEAEAERVRIMAVADAEKMKIQAEAAASHNRVALDRMLIDQLPQIVEKAALGLPAPISPCSTAPKASARWPAGLVSQGVAIFDALRGEVIDYDDEDDDAPARRRDSTQARNGACADGAVRPNVLDARTDMHRVRIAGVTTGSTTPNGYTLRLMKMLVGYR